MNHTNAHTLITVGERTRVGKHMFPKKEVLSVKKAELPVNKINMSLAGFHSKENVRNVVHRFRQLRKRYV